VLVEAAKKECIVLAAARAFARYGFKKASVDDIAKSAGVAKGTVYLATPSKKELFYEVLLREIHEWNAETDRLVDPRTPADELLVVMARTSLEALEHRPLVKGLLLGEYDHMLPDLRARLGELRAIGIGGIARVLNLGMRQGRFRSDLDVDEVASLLLDLQTATLLFHLHTSTTERLEKRAAVAFNLIFQGLRPRTA
jgi:AcrR family transcriptional regulator